MKHSILYSVHRYMGDALLNLGTAYPSTLHGDLDAWGGGWASLKVVYTENWIPLVLHFVLIL